MIAPNEKAAPIPADVLALAEDIVGSGGPYEADLRQLREGVARTVMQDRADQEARIREDEREACARVVDDFGVTWGASYRSMTDEIAKAVRVSLRGGAS